VISFYYDSVDESHLIYTEEIDIDPADSKNIYLMWGDQNLTGNHTIYAVADPKEYIIEINEENNQGNISLSFHSTIPLP